MHRKFTLTLNHPSVQNKTNDVVIQQNSRKLLMMDILMSEICWAHKKWNKIASDIKLVFYSSTTNFNVTALYRILRYFMDRMFFFFDAILHNMAGKRFNSLNHNCYCTIELPVFVLSNCYIRVQDIYIFSKFSKIDRNRFPVQPYPAFLCNGDRVCFPLSRHIIFLIIFRWISQFQNIKQCW